MEDLGPNPSIEAVEEEREFYQVLLETLDTSSPDYQEQKHSHERKIQIMDAYLDSKRSQPSAQASSTAPEIDTAGTSGSGQDVELPSRERHAVQTTERVAPDDVHGQQRKRAREDSLVGGAALNNSFKSRRTSPSDSDIDSLATTVDSKDSSDEATAMYDREALRRRMLMQQRQQEERIRQQRADEELARNLAAGMPASASTSAPTMGIPRSISQSSMPNSHQQSYFGPTGQIQRLPRATPAPLHPESSIAAQLPRTDSSSLLSPQQQAENTFAAQQPIGYTSTPGTTLNQADQPSPLPQMPSRGLLDAQNFTTMQQLRRPPAISLDSSGESDVELISPEQYRTPGSNQDRHLNMPGAFPGFGGASLGAGSYAGPSNAQLVDLYGSPSTHLRPGDSIFAQPSSFAPHHETNPGGSHDWMTSLLETTRNLTGGSLFGMGNPITIDSDDSDEGHEGYNSMYYRHRYYGGGYNNVPPAQTKADLEKLLKNIRPDEDLVPESCLQTPKAMRMPLMPHQRLGLTWLAQQEDGSNKGCILADDMGLGKTIQALALMLTRPSDDPACRTTLIIAPVALLKQWKDEIDDKVKPGKKLSTIVFHGPMKATFAKLASYDVVITSLGKVGAELKRKQDFELRQRNTPSLTRTRKDELVLLGDHCKWYRVIVDEAQSIKNKSTRGSQAACTLQAKHRLCMTGTPMMNNVGELYSLIHFLRIPPYNVYENFQRDIGKPVMREYSRPRAMRALQALLKAILLRRTKKSTIKDSKGVEQPILQLPPRHTEVVHAVFDKEQQEFYDALEKSTAMKANRFLRSGHIGRNYASILVLLLRLRQACDHPHLIKDLDAPEGTDMTDADMTELAGKFSETAISMIKESNGAFECPVCYDASENPTIFFPCGHDTCVDCFAKITDPSQAIAAGEENFTAKCPECRAPIRADKIITYNIFKKVHMPSEYVGDLTDMPETKDDSSESDSDVESESDADSQGDLRDFIVDDDEDDEESEGDESSKAFIKGEEADQDDEFNPGPSKPQPSSLKRSKPRSKGKGKVKGKSKAQPGKKQRKTLADLKREGQRNAKAKRKYLKRLERNYESSAKIDKTMEIIMGLEKESPEEKTIIFSQFTSFLDLLEVPIMRAGIGYRRYDGGMSARERETSLDTFKADPAVKVMLVSLRAGNAGLNLTSASQVIILDPFWNPYVEDQAIDRAHRIGQQRPVHVHRILCQGTVEDRIVALQERKRQLISEALDEEAGQQLSRLGVQELRYLFNMGGSLD